MVFIKAFVFVISVAIATSSFGQIIIAKDSLLHPQNANYNTDSFTFCNKTFKVPRDCSDKSLYNCCIYGNSSLVCGSEKGDFMNWYYLPTLDLARQIFEGSLETRESTNTGKISKRQVNWYLLGVKTTSWYIEAESNMGLKTYVVLSYGTVNGKFVVTEYYAHARITQNYILPKVFREIIRWD